MNRTSPNQGLLKIICFGVVFANLLIVDINAAKSTAVDVLTWHYDLARTGQNTNETLLTPDLVNPSSFGLLFSQPVDGFVYAQPLYLAGVSIPGKGTHNVVYVATEHNGVFAFDADSNLGTNAAPLWQVSFINPENKITAVPISDYGTSDPPAVELGITGTPAIDAQTGTLYVVAHIKDASKAPATYYHNLYALDVATGDFKFGSPVRITATTPGTGATSTGGIVSFYDFYHLQRSGLALVNGVIYIAFSSVGDIGPFHGWLMGYDSHTLQQTGVFNTTPNSAGAGIWMGSAGVAADEEGNIYCISGNGPFDADNMGVDYGDSLLKLTPGGDSLAVVDYFTPKDAPILANNDGDFGSGGVVLLPDDAGGKTHPHLAVGCGKDTTIFLIDRDNMGHFNPANNNQAVQSVPNGSAAPAGAIFGAPAYFNHTLYFAGHYDVLRAYSVSNAVVSSASISQASANLFNIGAVPVVSADGVKNGIVWLVESAGFSSKMPGVLRAYDASDLTTELYDSSMMGTRDQLAVGMKFSAPIISNGKVYVGTGGQLQVFGILPGGIPQLTVDTNLNLVLQGRRGLQYLVQFSDDLGESNNGWQDMVSVTLTSTSATLMDPNPSNGSHRYYRVLLTSP